MILSADCEGPDQTAHLCILIWVLALRMPTLGAVHLNMTVAILNVFYNSSKKRNQVSEHERPCITRVCMLIWGGGGGGALFAHIIKNSIAWRGPYIQQYNMYVFAKVMPSLFNVCLNLQSMKSLQT